MAGILDTMVLAGRATRELGELVGTDATGLAVRESHDLLVTRGGWHIRTPVTRAGLRIPLGDGVGGRVLSSRRPLSVVDYEREQRISPRLVEQMRCEGVHAMLGVPIMWRGEIIGVLYAANRSPGEVGDRAKTLALEFADTLGPMLGAAVHSGRATRLSACEERQRSTVTCTTT